MSSSNKFKPPSKIAIAVDIVVFGYSEGLLNILLIERGIEPFKNQWALPGGFIHENESIETAANRELIEETGISVQYLEQLYTYGDPNRDPRERVVSVAYYALVRTENHILKASTDAKNAKWFHIEKAPNLAFDHGVILKQAVNRLRTKCRYEPLAFNLLPIEFTLFQLQQFYEAILGRALDKRNFRTKILKYGILKKRKKLRNVNFRSPNLFQFDSKKYQRLQKRGIALEI
jgi:8-oxo-dGTP diphosphatase